MLNPDPSITYTIYYFQDPMKPDPIYGHNRYWGGRKIGKTAEVKRRMKEMLEKNDHVWMVQARPEFGPGPYPSFAARKKDGKILFKSFPTGESLKVGIDTFTDEEN